ncbi:MAG: nucleotidyl transferase AbiEii/AbiGii toxin family protein [Candidatus Obscuribacterales bacterium]|nr:nucleotidyl transferase AbiEii/AbiGii toxin family protein [Candidatus Obscuribacterales bacterium]
MIPANILGRVVHSSGVQDETLVRLDVLSVYLLERLNETGLLDHMCFKGGISLRKVFARQPSRFSRDVDFVDSSYEQLTDTGLRVEDYYIKVLEGFDNQTVHDILWKVKNIDDESLHAPSLRIDVHFFIYDDRPDDHWERRTDNVLSIECSFRRPIYLKPQLRQLRNESWFRQLEFEPSPVPVLQTEEAIAEKIRAAFQRSNPRDIFDLHQYGQLTFREELVRKLTVLKCWQDRGTYDGPSNFNADELLGKLRLENYPWERLRAQVSNHAWIEPGRLLDSLRNRYNFITDLGEQELVLCNDRGQSQQPLHDNLWEECRNLHDERE